MILEETEALGSLVSAIVGAVEGLCAAKHLPVLQGERSLFHIIGHQSGNQALALETGASSPPPRRLGGGVCVLGSAAGGVPKGLVT